MSPSSRAIVLAVAALVVQAEASGAQERLCRFSTAGRMENVGQQTIVIHDPFTVTCEDGAELRAESGRVNQASSEMQAFGNVFFRDSVQSLTANEATYNRVSGRLWASGNVVLENLEEGSVLRGPELEYFRETETRPVSQVIAPRRPTLTLSPRSEENAGNEPLVLVADRVLITGEDDLSAFGSVVITRTDLNATSEEARYNSESEDMELRGGASIASEEYDLTGEVIQIAMTDGSLQHVHARRDARLEGEDSQVAAPDLQLFFEADSLKRAVAVSAEPTPEIQPRAWSSDFELSADSIDAAFEEQRIRVVTAIGTARAESTDSTGLRETPPQPDSVSGDFLDRAASDSLATAFLDRLGDADAATPRDSASATTPDSLAATDPAPATPPVRDPLSRDWIVGDTILAFFEVVIPTTDPDSVAQATESPGEPEETVELRRLVAIGSAQSLYRVAPQDQPAGARRNINFLVGDRIELNLVESELRIADVHGLKRGVYLEASQTPAGVSEGDPSTPSPPGDLIEPPLGQ